MPFIRRKSEPPAEPPLKLCDVIEAESVRQQRACERLEQQRTELMLKLAERTLAVIKESTPEELNDPTLWTLKEQIAALEPDLRVRKARLDKTRNTWRQWAYRDEPVVCPCGREVGETATVCPKCKRSLDQIVPAAIDRTLKLPTIRCRCGRHVRMGAAYCPSCGNRVDDPNKTQEIARPAKPMKCWRCMEPVEPGARVCKKCDARVL